GVVVDSTPLTQDDAQALRRRLGHLLTGVAPTQATLRVVSTGSTHVATMITGCTADLLRVRAWDMANGRFLDEDDVKKQASVCVLGQTVRNKLFPGDSAPIGQLVRIDFLEMRVVGVTGAKGRSPTGADQDDQIFVPLTTLQHRLVGEERLSVIA